MSVSLILCPASAIEAERVRLIIFALDSAYNAGKLVPSYLYGLYLGFPLLVPFSFRNWMLEKRSPDNPLFGSDSFSFPYLPSVFRIVDHLTSVVQNFARLWSSSGLPSSGIT